jgi:hypothetical protein
MYKKHTDKLFFVWLYTEKGHEEVGGGGGGGDK